MSNKRKKILVTGGAGFIGSHMVELLAELNHRVIVLDALTYAGNIQNIRHLLKNFDVDFIEGRIEDKNLVSQILEKFKIDVLINFAAETHVDNSISSPRQFIGSNVIGTFELVLASQEYLERRSLRDFKFVQISTDEVFGEVGSDGKGFSESTSYAPRSPYSASKASADHIVRAWCNTYGFPGLITHCSNNFGPRQNKEKLIPKIITNAIRGKKIPIYGDGKNIRDWLYVTDHCKGIYQAIEKGRAGESYCFGGGNEYQNIQIAQKVCAQLDEIRPLKNDKFYASQIEYVEDRKGHDRHYAVDFTKASKELGYKPEHSIDPMIRNTIEFYLSLKKS
jgi:dTDP-glucose 4,6-dehydratase